MSVSSPRVSREFRTFVRHLDATDDPLEVALAIEGALGSDTDPGWVRGRILDLARLTSAHPGRRERGAHLGRFLGRERGFAGNSADYGHPDNALISRVLLTRRGLPAALSVLYVAVARAADVPLAVISLPGHSVVADLSLVPPLILDPFRRGIEIDSRECDRIVETVTGGELLSAERHLARAARPRSLATRLLNDLLMAFWHRRDLRRALLVTRLGCTVDPTGAQPLRARACVYDRMRRYPEAIVDYESCVRRPLDASEKRRVERRVTYLRSKLRPPAAHEGR